MRFGEVGSDRVDKDNVNNYRMHDIVRSSGNVPYGDGHSVHAVFGANFWSRLKHRAIKGE